MSNHTFCRKLLAEVMKEVREKVSKEDIKKAYAHETFGTFEFHGPNGFYRVCRGDCKWSAKADGWERYLKHQQEKEQ